MNRPKSQQAMPPVARLTPEKSGQPDKAAQISKHIGQELRAMFDDVVAEPVPERFQELLDELEQNQSKD